MTKIKTGDCYEAHWNAFIDGTPGLLCHGTVWHPKVGWHGHCWIELNENVVMDISNSGHVIMRRERYYAIGRIKDVSKYDLGQVRAISLKERTLGPWKTKNLMTKTTDQAGKGGV